MPTPYKVLSRQSEITPPPTPEGSGSIPASGSVVRARPYFHQLKTWLGPFRAVYSGDKTFEVRRNDRDFRVGDYLILQEWNHLGDSFTGRVCMRRVQYVFEGGQFGIESGFVVMSLSQQID